MDRDLSSVLAVTITTITSFKFFIRVLVTNSLSVRLCHIDLSVIVFQSTDIDECAKDSSICQFTCANTDGSYKCSCPIGYVLRADKKTCTGQ